MWFNYAKYRFRWFPAYRQLEQIRTRIDESTFNEVAFFKTAFFFFGLILQVSFKTRVALPEATPSPFGTAMLRLAPPPSLRSGSARSKNSLRPAQQ